MDLSPIIQFLIHVTVDGFWPVDSCEQEHIFQSASSIGAAGSSERLYTLLVK
jgi:hypothetical protein